MARPLITPALQPPVCKCGRDARFTSRVMWPDVKTAPLALVVWWCVVTVPLHIIMYLGYAYLCRLGLGQKLILPFKDSKTFTQFEAFCVWKSGYGHWHMTWSWVILTTQLTVSLSLLSTPLQTEWKWEKCKMFLRPQVAVCTCVDSLHAWTSYVIS